MTPQPGEEQPELFAALMAPPPAVDSSVKLEREEVAETHAPAPQSGSAENVEPASGSVPSTPARPEKALVIRSVLADMAAEEDCTYRSTAVLFQDFGVRCRMQRIGDPGVDMLSFRRRFAVAIAGGEEHEDPRWQAALKLGERVQDDVLAPFLLIARAAIEGHPCPDDDALARAYGTRSVGRIRRLLEYLEKNDLIVVRTDFGGRRSVGIPELGLTTAPAEV